MEHQPVQVTAPATLDAGFQFDCEVDGHTVTVTVPDGGVKQGQVFTVDTVDRVSDAYQPPKGAWKDDLCDCCAHGCCHPSCCASWWLPFIGLAQIMARMNLTWFADPGKPGDSPSKTFKTVFITFLVLYALYSASYVNPTLATIMEVLYAVPLIILGMKTRSFIRRKYEIPGSGLEDCCCVFWCQPCSISQMLRHTADYNGNTEADCCSPTGIHIV